MSAAEISEPQRVSFVLDPGLVLERLILRRVSGLKRQRRQDWLRSLLVQGFLSEGRLIRFACPPNGDGASAHGPGIPITAFGSWLECADAPARRPVKPTPRPRMVSAVCTAALADAETKPFAHLRKVIG